MNIDPPGPILALIAGPTASGKSALALALAEAAGGTIINADSAQVYRDLRLVSARPSEADEARAAHRLYGYRDGARPCSAADWAKDARAEIEAAIGNKQLPILAGGTGLYIRTLLEGIAPIPEIDPVIRSRVRALPVDEARLALEAEDPQAAARLRATDSSRIARALEVIRSTGHSILDWRKEKAGGISSNYRLKPIILLPPRDWLHARCDARFEAIFSSGGLDEVQKLLDRGLAPSSPVMRAIGVPEMAAFLHGQLDRENAIAAGQRATRQYAKRQYTWFRNQPPADWPRMSEPLDCGRLPDVLARFGL